MFKVVASDNHYNSMYFKFSTVEDAQNFANILFAGVDAEKTTGLSVTISYHEIFEKEDEE